MYCVHLIKQILIYEEHFPELATSIHLVFELFVLSMFYFFRCTPSISGSHAPKAAAQDNGVDIKGSGRADKPRGLSNHRPWSTVNHRLGDIEDFPR